MSVSANSRVASFGSVVLALAFGLSGGSVPAAHLNRGRALYDTHCRQCHESVAYRTKQKIAKTYVEARAQVVRWQTNYLAAMEQRGHRQRRFVPGQDLLQNSMSVLLTDTVQLQLSVRTASTP